MAKKFNTKIDNGFEHLLGYEPFFKEYVSIATALPNRKVVKPCHGYFSQHPHSQRSKLWAKSLEYEFNND